MKAGGKGEKEHEMVGWHHRLNGHESEQTPGDVEGQGSLACCSPWGCKESDMTEQVNNNNVGLSTVVDMEMHHTDPSVVKVCCLAAGYAFYNLPPAASSFRVCLSYSVPKPKPCHLLDSPHQMASLERNIKV